MKTIPIFKRLILLFIAVNFISMITLSSEMTKLYRLYKKGQYSIVVKLANAMIEDQKDVFVAYYYLAKTLSTEAYEDKDNQRANSNIKKLRVLGNSLSEDIKKRCYKRGRFNTDSIVNLHTRINQKGLMIAISSDSKSCLWKPYDYYLENYDNKDTPELSDKADSLRYIRYTKPNTKKVREKFDEKFHDNSKFCKVNIIEYNRIFINEIDTCNSYQINKVYYVIKNNKLIFKSTITYCKTQYNSKLILDFEELKSIIKRFEFFQQLSNKITHPETKINLSDLAAKTTKKEFLTLKNSVSQRVYIDSLLSFPFIDIEDGTWWNDIIDTYNETLLNERENTPPGAITNFLNTHEKDTLITRKTRTKLIVILNKAYSDSINKTFEIEIILSLFESWSNNNYKNKILLANEWDNFVEEKFKNILISKTSEEIEELLAKHSLDSLITDEIEDIYINKVFAEFDLKILDKKTDYLHRLHKLLKNNKFYFNKILQYTIIPELKIRLNNCYKSVIANESTLTAKRYKIIDWRNNKYQDSIMVKDAIIDYHSVISGLFSSLNIELWPSELIDWKNDPLTKIFDKYYKETLNKFTYKIKNERKTFTTESFGAFLLLIKKKEILNDDDIHELSKILENKRRNKWENLVITTKTDYSFCQEILKKWIDDSDFPLPSDFKINAINEFCDLRFNQITPSDTYESYSKYLDIIKKDDGIFQCKYCNSKKIAAEDLVFSKLTNCQCIEGFEKFLKNHSNIKRYVKKAHDGIWSFYKDGAVKSLIEFFDKYPNNPNRDIALNLIVIKADYEEFINFLANHPKLNHQKLLEKYQAIHNQNKQIDDDIPYIDSIQQDNKQIIEKVETTDLHKNLQQVEGVTSNTETELINDNQKIITVNPKETTSSSAVAVEEEVP